MDNKIKYSLIILFQIKEIDGHIEYFFRLSEKKNPNHFVDFKMRYQKLAKLNQIFLSEKHPDGFPSFPKKIYIHTDTNLNKRFKELKNYFFIIFNEYEFYKLNSVQRWIKDTFNKIEKTQDNNNQIFEKNYNDNEKDTFLDLITFDFVDDENIGLTIQKNFNVLNFNNSHYISIPKGNDNNFKHLIKDETILDYEMFLIMDLLPFLDNLNNLKLNYSIDKIRNDFNI